MTEHDPLCPFDPDATDPTGECQCALIARVRADEREQIATGSLAWVAARTAEKIAQAIDAQKIPSARDHGPEAEAVNDGLGVAWRAAREVAEEASVARD
jgi:hypothetical protein